MHLILKNRRFLTKKIGITTVFGVYGFFPISFTGFLYSLRIMFKYNTVLSHTFKKKERMGNPKSRSSFMFYKQHTKDHVKEIFWYSIAIFYYKIVMRNLKNSDSNLMIKIKFEETLPLFHSGYTIKILQQTALLFDRF